MLSNMYLESFADADTGHLGLADKTVFFFTRLEVVHENLLPVGNRYKLPSVIRDSRILNPVVYQPLMYPFTFEIPLAQLILFVERSCDEGLTVRSPCCCGDWLSMMIDGDYIPSCLYNKSVLLLVVHRGNAYHRIPYSCSAIFAACDQLRIIVAPGEVSNVSFVGF